MQAVMGCQKEGLSNKPKYISSLVISFLTEERSYITEDK
jgi:hypothetical protein